MVVLETEKETTPCLVLQVYVLNPKQNLYGLGYDPFKHAPEFRGM